MYIKNIHFLLMVFVVSNLNANGADTEIKTDMYPKAKKGYIKYIITVPKTKNDYDHKTEVIIGQEKMVDCNTHRVIANIEERALKGWGYTYLYVTSDSNHSLMSTKKGCLKKKEKKFIQVYDKILLRRYNSQLPIVVYAPKYLSVRYRIWNVSEKIEIAPKE